MIYNIYDFGAKGDSLTDDTDSLQQAIDKCSFEGGGIVLVDDGTFKVGTIYFKDDVTIEVGIRGKIIAQTERHFYKDDTHHQMYTRETHMDKCLFFAKECKNIGLTGRGEIDGCGSEFKKFRPMLFRYLDCENIRITNIKLRNPASWTNAFIGCNNIWVDGIDIKSRANNNGDGLDFDGCENVFVSNCKFDCSDDCICLQNSYFDRVCKNIVVTNCIFSSRWAGMRIGLLSCGPIEFLTVSNCIFSNIDCSGLKIQSAEGSNVSHMTFTNLVMNNVQRPIFMTANKFREKTNTETAIETPSVVSDMTFSNIISRSYDKNKQLLVENQPSCIVLDCEGDNTISDIVIKNVTMQTYGKQDSPFLNDYSKIPTHSNIRGECKNYHGNLPASALFARNIKNLHYSGLQISEKHKTHNKDICII
ncbi:glycoside hydrolase family 28 protein [Candidatus Epulonipiscium viviparus]|uniref:glycoside hydrolase family 28 protein n=1 Tax=Candidatus Epulonipiscium viviparus TaxID=420336 RepID=UPI002738138A|nr:glycosyl hydrolase family 28 protein [Candidatus Epulopiscium viviparus]